MTHTIHVKLSQRDAESVALRYYADNPNDYHERVLALDDIAHIIKAAETDYYTLLPADSVQFGQTLYRWLDSADRFLARALDDQPDDGQPLALAIDTDGELNHLPWELLHDGDGFLVARETTPVIPVRWQPGDAPAPPPQNRPLHLLFMAASPLDVQPRLNFEGEEASILAATRRQPLALTVEESGNLGELRHLVASFPDEHFDVVHLTGHATHVDHSPYFLTESETGQAHLAAATELRDALRRLPRLLFLSGCRTGEAAAAGSVPSLAEALLALGVGSVLGWGRPVLDTDATAAAAALYGSLAAGFSPLEALADTYRTLSNAKTRDWHLLRLYTAGGMPGPLVTPRRTPGRARLTRPPQDHAYLDDERTVRVAGRSEFVGRRRILQRSLRVLRHGERPPDQANDTDPNDTPPLGVVLHGTGGLGKSTLAARLIDRLNDTHRAIVWTGALDEAGLLHRLGRTLREPRLREELNSRDELRFRLLRVLEEIDPETELLLVLDNFEDNYEQRNGQIDLPDGAPLVTPAAVELLEALVFALRESGRAHRLLITARYSFDLSLARHFYVQPLAGMEKADVEKKVDRLRPAPPRSHAARTRRERAVEIADGNPRLLEWLFAVLDAPELDHAAILERMAEKATEFRADILAAELLAQQEADLRRLLARLLVYELPAPEAAARAVSEGLPDFERHRDRAAALGLLETVRAPEGERLLRAPQILEPLLHDALDVDATALAHTAAETLHRLWWEEGDSNEAQALEIHRLALAGGAKDIAVEIGNDVASRWVNRSRFREAAVLAQKTLDSSGATYRLLNTLARAQRVLGEVHVARKLYQRALDLCPADDEKFRATLLNNLGRVYDDLGDKAKALEHYNQALPLSRQVGDKSGEATTLNNLGLVYDALGDKQQALDFYQQALPLRRQVGDRSGESITRYNMAMVYRTLGDLARAEAHLAITVALDEAIGHPDLESDRAMLQRVRGELLQQLLNALAEKVGAETVQAALDADDGGERLRALLAEHGLLPGEATNDE